MASINDSLYFNPMVTNGVVHTNVLGIKDWVTPYKIAQPALLPLPQGPDITFYLNNLQVQDVFSSTHSLLHYFDHLILTGAESKSNGEEDYDQSLRYAALNLAALHCRFGHYQQAELALQETTNKPIDALKDSDLLHWKHSLSELINISITQKMAIWRLYGHSTMALQQVQMLLSINSLESVNTGVQQNNTESFAVALCQLAELHIEQGCFVAAAEMLKHLKERFPPNTQHAQLWMLCDQNIQFDRAMNDYLTSETVLNLAFALLILGIPEQALTLLHMAMEPMLAHGAILDKGHAMFLVTKCQVTSAASYDPLKKAEALKAAMENLNEAKNYFAKVDCEEQIRDVIYFQARVYLTLGKTQGRNPCAMIFQQVHQELPSYGVPLINHL
ncbi:Anaphase-promoting complex subunit 5 [Sciurus carolinensis]|uniref:Anaphase-promoting complex subunit 5 n=1 Tax=Sciurus carolinensis TaxID=30640 RepID=A0AA41MQP2_SCICA|nr:Anaphase-promoting complex subunit 5 [Sciurus carolinensis]